MIAGSSSGVPYIDARFDNYQDSMEKITKISTGLFGHLFKGDEALSLEKFKEATEDGEGGAIMVGTPHLAMCWWPCVKCEPLVSN